MFGYRLVPHDLYTLMVAALTPPAAVTACSCVSAPSLVGAPSALSQSGATVTIPPAVAAACEEYGFGDREEVTRNFRHAEALLAKGIAPESVVQKLREGADVSGLFL